MKENQIQEQNQTQIPNAGTKSSRRISMLKMGIVLVVFGAATGYLVWARQNQSWPFVEQQVGMCTKEAKLCPDGSAVGRTGPACEFAACPEAQVQGQTYRNEEFGFELALGDAWKGYKVTPFKQNGFASFRFEVPVTEPVVGQYVVGQYVYVFSVIVNDLPPSKVVDTQTLGTGILLAKNSRYVYGYTYPQDPAGIPFTDIHAEIDQVISTIKYSDAGTRMFITYQTLNNGFTKVECSDDLDGDPANTVVKYSSFDEGRPITFDVPFNDNWGGSKYAIEAYEESYDQETKAVFVKFGNAGGLEGCGNVRSYTLKIGPAESKSQVITGAKQQWKYTDVKTEEVKISGFTVIKYNGGEVCENVNMVIIGEKANYRFSTVCGGGFSDLEKLIKTVKLEPGF